MEIVCDLDMRIWSCSFGFPGSMNDLNILDASPFFQKMLAGAFPSHSMHYSIAGEDFDWLYLLADGIYPKYKIFVRTISDPINIAQSRYTRRVAAARSCVERVFGVLLKQFGILRVPGRLWYSTNMTSVLRACIVIHNMVVATRKGTYMGKWY